jgi:hypothetical protein
MCNKVVTHSYSIRAVILPSQAKMLLSLNFVVVDLAVELYEINFVKAISDCTLFSICNKDDSVSKLWCCWFCSGVVWQTAREDFVPREGGWYQVRVVICVYVMTYVDNMNFVFIEREYVCVVICVHVSHLWWLMWTVNNMCEYYGLCLWYIYFCVKETSACMIFYMYQWSHLRWHLGLNVVNKIMMMEFGFDLTIYLEWKTCMCLYRQPCVHACVQATSTHQTCGMIFLITFRTIVCHLC